ncbi:hypothetical protein NQZ68_016193 [Dissostichus eleginoides]|nr:hypothetical protein NQZ68_016193 [Dissostichus eleginoides]
MIIELSKNIWRRTLRDAENEDKAVFQPPVGDLKVRSEDFEVQTSWSQRWKILSLLRYSDLK